MVAIFRVSNRSCERFDAHIILASETSCSDQPGIYTEIGTINFKCFVQ